ncbi:proteasome regulatory particle base subunit RPN2 NDAI_0A03100 [Naumovozyma dairenensis CBS 421]|uniref:26S proteasome regulatory subunit RPN2 n=1 Tax=Naumovozyma dairenensis (strain ATCC 10597 / BCRC 20456 / CBS 421 / NBRC 0211 / NRRL Y-12639) TaxID=1071378 RepID=G0W3S9_NAUDC|nr:hypothetical protein NDAI_0A03100 [Naumovozyma dairenensis CBS 421]CCD22467.1 hypothetical protein NDAI_0A03100 [Naumovozyma dairenensis CBS 421]
MSLTTAAPLLALLREEDSSLKSYALRSIDEVVDQLWPEVANEITDIESLYDDASFTDRKLAALIASKVYYNLGEYESAVKFALAAEEKFDIDEKSQYVETIVSQSIQMYIKLATEYYAKEYQKIDPKLTLIFERMMIKCVLASEFKLALGIAAEGFRLDLIENILRKRIAEDSDVNSLKLVSYVLTTATTNISNTIFRTAILKSLYQLLMSMGESTDYFIIFKIVVNLNDAKYAIELFERLKDSGSTQTSYQIAFDLVSAASQNLLDTLLEDLTKKNYDPILLDILTGRPTCDYYNTFLLNNKNIDTELLNKCKASLDGKFSLFHTALSVANGFMHAGTTDNSFIKANLPWLGKANNWAKFTATASLGVIHQGNLTEGKVVMKPYLPGSRTTSRFIKGGSLYALGLIYAGFGKEISSYLDNIVGDNAVNTGDEDIDVLIHGGSLGLGLASMGSSDIDAYERLRDVFYMDNATASGAAALGMGLTMLGSGDNNVMNDLFNFKDDTDHGNVTRDIGIALALVNYGRQELADDQIEKLVSSDDPLLRYGGTFTIALAYAGTGSNKAVKKLLHIAVSDSNDDVRRGAVIGLGFVLLRDYTTVPRIVQLLSKSHNAHVRCGTAFALGIACAGKALPSAISVLEPLTKDPVDFVRQAAMIALSLILIQQTEKLNPSVKAINENFLKVVTNKHQEGLAKFGACVAQGIMNAGGRNVTIQLENTETGTLDAKAVVGLAMFSQFWYWFPLSHFLSLSFTPTAVIGVRGSDLNIPKFDLNCFAKEHAFDYPKMYKESANKEVEKVATAVLSTTARAKARAKKTKKDKDEDKNRKTKKESQEEKSRKEDEDEETVDEEDVYKSKYSAKPYKIVNMSRVLPQQSRYISFNKQERFVPVRKFKGNMGIIVLEDKEPSEPIDLIETVRQMKDVNAPLPTPFKVEDNVEYNEDA